MKAFTWKDRAAMFLAESNWVVGSNAVYTCPNTTNSNHSHFAIKISTIKGKDAFTLHYEGNGTYWFELNADTWEYFVSVVRHISLTNNSLMSFKNYQQKR